MADPRPQPVLKYARLGGLVNSAFVACGGAYLLISQGITGTNLSTVGTSIEGAVTAVVALGVYLATVIHGKAAADEVTPLSDPQDDRGRPLVAAGRHAAPEDDETAWIQSLREQEPPTVMYQQIPERPLAGRRLGRHVNHDPRSLSFLVPETDTPTTAMWQRRVPVFDQGDLGSCTGNAAAGVLGTDPFYGTLPAGLVDDEGEAVTLYSAATKLDGYRGQYPPTDTGSDGLSVAKACKAAGLISGYQHITSVAAAQTAIKTGPFIVGTNWYTSMDTPDSDGRVTVSGQVRGGHEYECHGYDAQADLWWFTNSWGESWGKAGTFCMSSASLARLLSEQGDATVFLPIAAPAPTPTPTPTPLAPPADVVAWAKRVVAEKQFSKRDKKAAGDLLHWLGLQ